MYCDALTLAAVADELRHNLLGGRVQEVLLVDRLVIGLEIYARRRQYLLISAQPGEGGRIHLVQHKLRRGVDSPSPLLLRLRKELCGGRLVDVEQPPLERLLRLTIERSHKVLRSAQDTRVLVVEIMGQRSNVLLLEEDNTILECARHVSASQNRYRVLLPGHLYIPPPPQNKAYVQTLTANRLHSLLAGQDPELPLWQKLVSAVFGVSPLLAREVAYRVSGDAQCRKANAQAVLMHLQELLSLATTGQWQPSVALQGDEVVAYAPYTLTQYPQRKTCASISEAMLLFYSQWTGKDTYAVAKGTTHSLIQKQRERLLHKREALLSAYPTLQAVEELRRNGELLLAYAHEVVPGQSELIVPWSEEKPPVRIMLASNLSAIENARAYFRRYEKAKSAAAEVPRLLSQVESELAYLDQLSTDLALAEDRPGIHAVESALAEAGYIPKPPKARRVATAPLRVLSPDGFTILLGRNSWQNEQVTFRYSASHDLWLHAKAVPGAHVVIRSEGRDVPASTLRFAAELAAYYSAARQEKKVLVDYTLRKHVRRLPGGRQGQVIYTGEKTISVRPHTVPEMPG